jgi:hypothetical protein
VLDCWRAYDDQYLMIEARPGVLGRTDLGKQRPDTEELAERVAHFRLAAHRSVALWRQRLGECHRRGEHVVLWGGGSKAVAFLTTLGIKEEIEYVVDINPHKQGTFVAGSGQQIVSPGSLRGYKPDRVIVMNPIYRDEIRNELDRLGVSVDLVVV